MTVSDEKTVKIVASELFCSMWGLNSCQTTCEDCINKARNAIYKHNIPSGTFYVDVIRMLREEMK